MLTIDTPALLGVWDAGHLERAEHWALGLLAWADASTSAEALARLSVGERDARLLAVRNALFGRRIGIVETCPGCGERLESHLDGQALLLAAPVIDPAGFVLRAAGCEIHFRLPDSIDLADASDCGSVEVAEALLIERCVLAARTDDGLEIEPRALSAAALEALSQRMDALDPQADLRVSMRCDNCGHVCSLVFDVVPFLWRELDAWAVRTLHEVHRLAREYHWSEASILRMGTARRRRYLAMLDS